MTRSAAGLAASRSSIASDASTPVTSTPRDASGTASRPVPTPSSRTGPGPAERDEQVHRRVGVRAGLVGPLRPVPVVVHVREPVAVGRAVVLADAGLRVGIASPPGFAIRVHQSCCAALAVAQRRGVGLVRSLSGMPETVYLDHAATTPMRPEAVEAMLPWLRGRSRQPVGLAPPGPGRPAGGRRRPRRAGRAGRLPPRRGRVHLRGHRGRQPGGVGVPRRRGGPACAARSSTTRCSTRCGPGGGRRGGGRRRGADRPRGPRPGARGGDDARTVGVVSVLLANNEVGTVQDLAAVRSVVDAEAPGAVLHTDAVQAFAVARRRRRGPHRPTWCR